MVSPTNAIGPAAAVAAPFVVTALVARLDDGLACAIPGVPAVDLGDLIAHHAGVRHDERVQEDLALVRQVGRVVSPLTLTPRVPPECRFIYAGLGDRLVHPRHQVARLWEHWGRPDIEWFNGSHIGFFRSKPVWRFVEAALERAGRLSTLAAPERRQISGGVLRLAFALPRQGVSLVTVTY